MSASFRAALLFLTALLAVGPLAAETSRERLLNATFKVFNSASTATGFLVQDPAPQAASTNVLLVSAAHTFAKAHGDHVLLVCRIRKSPDEWARYDHKVMIRQGTNSLWTSHPSQDIAVIRCTLPPNASFEALPLSAIADGRAAQTRGLTVGSHFFYFGFPERTEASTAGFPLFREGVVSGYPLFPAQRYPLFLFSAPTFAGDSGAPAALERPGDEWPLVIGLVVTRTQQNDKLKSEGFEMTFKRDMDLGSLLHAEYIRETIGLLK